MADVDALFADDDTEIASAPVEAPAPRAPAARPQTSEIDLDDFAPDPSRLPVAATPTPGASPSWGDWGRYAIGGAGQTLSSTGAGLEYFLGKGMVGDWLQAAGKGVSDAQMQQLTPAGRKALTDDLWGANNFMSTLAAKAISAAPSLATTIIPGVGAGRLALAVGAGMRGAGAAGFGAAAGVGSAQSAGGVFEQIGEGIKKAPEDQLRKASEAYVALRDSGMDDAAAREALVRQAAGYKPAIAAAITAITSKFGVEGMVAARLAGNVAARGMLKGAVVGAAGEGFQETVESAAQEYLAQKGLVEAGTQKEIDWSKVAKQGFEGGVVGGIIGGGTGAVTNLRPSPAATVTPPQAQDTPVDADQQAALDAVTSSTPDAAVPETAEAEPDVEEAAVDPDEDPITSIPGMREALIRPPAETAGVSTPSANEGPAPLPGTPAPSAVVEDTLKAQQARAEQTAPNFGNNADVTAALVAAQPKPKRGKRKNATSVETVVEELSQPVAPPPPAPAPEPVQMAPSAPPAAVAPLVESAQQTQEPPPAPPIEDEQIQLRETLTPGSIEPEPLAPPPAEPAPVLMGLQTQQEVQTTPEPAPAVDVEAMFEPEAAPSPTPAPEPAPMRPRHAEIQRQLVSAAEAEMSERPADPREENRTIRREAVQRAAEEFRPRIVESQDAPGPAVRQMRDEFVAAARRHAQEIEEGQQREAILREKVEGEAASEAARKAAREREVERTGKDKGKSAEGLQKESERSHVRAARKAVEEQGEDAPSWARDTMAAVQERSTKGRGGGDRAEAVRFKANLKIENARKARADAEVAKGNATTSLAERAAAKRKKAQVVNDVREDQVRKIFEANPIRFNNRGVELPANTRERIAAIQAAIKAENIELPLTIARDQSPFVNMAVLANKVKRPTSSDAYTVDDFIVDEMLTRAGRHDDVLDSHIGDRGIHSAQKAATFEDVNKALERVGSGAGAQRGPKIFSNAPVGWDFIEPMPQPRVTGVKIGDIYSAKALMQKIERFVGEDAAPRGTVEHGLQYLGKILRERLTHLVGDIPVQLIDNAEMQLRSDKKGFTASGLYYSRAHSIYLNADLLAHPVKMRRVLLHEMVHGATVFAYDNNINNARVMFDRIAHHASISLKDTTDSFGRPWYAFAKDEKTGRPLTEEFIAEAYSNDDFKARLATTPLPAHLASTMRAISASREPTWWDYIVASVQNLLNMAGLGKRGTTYLDAVLKLAPDVMLPTAEMQHLQMNLDLENELAFPGMVSQDDPFGVYPMLEPVKKAAAATILRGNDLGLDAAPGARRWAFWMMSTAQIGRWARDLFTGVGDANVFEKLTRMYVAAGPEVRKIMLPGNDLMLELARFTKNYYPTAEKLSDIAHNSTVHQVDPTVPITHANNKHLGKTGFRWAQAREVYKAERAKFLALPQEAQDLLVRLADFYRGVQNEMTRVTLDSILSAADEKQRFTLPPGETLEKVRDWVLSGKIDIKDETRLDPRDKALQEMLGGLGRHLSDATDMRLVKGLYVPLMRRGDYVVIATHPVTAPSSGTLVDGNKIVFKNKKDAEAWLKQTQEHVVSVKSIWVDEATGERVKKEDSAGASAQRIIVTVQNKHVEFFERRSEGERRKKELLDSGVYGKNVTDVMHRDEAVKVREFLPSQVNKMIASIDARSLPSATKTMARNAVIDAAFRSMAGTRVQHRRLARRGVLGFSKDLVLALRDYNTSTSNYLGRLKYLPAMEKQIELIEDYINVNRNAGGRGHETMARQAALAEMVQRVHNTEDFFAGNWVSRVTTLSYLAHLMSPAFSLINSMQVGMVTMPYLIGQHPLGRTLRELRRAYAAVGGLREFGQGLVDTGIAFKEIKTGPSSRAAPHSAVRILDRVKTQPDADLLTRALNKAIDFGLVDNDAGQEIERSEIGKRGADIYLNRVAGLARALPQHIEAINRTVTIVAAARLAKQAGKSDAEAIQAAVDAVEATQGDYSVRGTARMFHSKPARVMLQFKKYPQMMGHLIARNIKQSFKGASPEERKQARKMLAALGLTTAAMAGAAGLPWELGRALVMTAWALGLAEDWDQYEANVQRILQGVIGDKPAEVVMYGAPRAVGIDISNRVGLESMFLFGNPKDAKANDVKAWLFDTIAGAPGGVVSDGLKAIAAGVAGEHGDMAKSLPFPKVVKDTLKAMQGYSEGKVSKTGKPLAKPLTLGEAATKAFGLRPASEARQFEAGGSGREQKEERGRAAEAAALKNAWVKAAPGAARDRQWKKIQDWNKSHPDNRVTMSDLRRLEQRRKKENTKAKRELEDA